METTYQDARLPQSRADERRVAIFGGGPAGLMAAEAAAGAGARVTIYERMPSIARKFLMAGRGGLNITHGEPLEIFMRRYGEAAERLRPAIEAFSPRSVREWCAGLGIDTFEGTSGRIFPKCMKASPLLRAWLRRLEGLGVVFRIRRTFCGFDEAGAAIVENAEGERALVKADAIVLAMGGASWPRLGSNGGWQEALATKGIEIAPLRPANCGFEAEWPAFLRERYAGGALKNIALSFEGARVRGECVLAEYGLEGGAIYALSAQLRDAIERDGFAELIIDLKPDVAADALARKLTMPRGKASISNHLRKRAGLAPLEIALLRAGGDLPADAWELAARIKSVAVRLQHARALERAISTAGGVHLSQIDENFMLRKLPGAFVAGEMLDWEAPTGGYLLQGCLATGRAAGIAAARWAN